MRPFPSSRFASEAERDSKSTNPWPPPSRWFPPPSAQKGLEVNHGQDIVLAGQPDHFADACLALLDDADRRRRIAEAGRRLVVERFSWDRVADCFEQILEAGPSYRSAG